MSLLSAIDISASALSCERQRMEIIAQNIANTETTETNGGGPYRRKVVVFKETLQKELNGNKNSSTFTGNGVEISKIVTDNAPPLMEYDPQNPDANKDGYVSKPNINLANEMVDSLTATRAYAANVTVLNATKEMALKALTIGKG
jgi:flagellar basal-body rod protein FlgC